VPVIEKATAFFSNKQKSLEVEGKHYNPESISQGEIQEMQAVEKEMQDYNKKYTETEEAANELEKICYQNRDHALFKPTMEWLEATSDKKTGIFDPSKLARCRGSIKKFSREAQSKTNEINEKKLFD